MLGGILIQFLPDWLILKIIQNLPDLWASKGLFETETIFKTVQETLIRVPLEHKIAFVTVANNDGVRAVFAVRASTNWQIHTYGQISRTKKPEFGAVVQWSK